MGAAAEHHVLASQSDQLGDPQAGLDRDEQQGVVAPADPAGAVGAGQEGVDFVLGQELHDGALGALGRDGKDACDEGGVLGMAEGGEAEHGVQRGEAGVAGADGVAALGLEVVQEGADELGVEVLELQPGRRPAGLLCGEGQEQLEGVPVGGHGVGAGLALADQPQREVGLEGWGELGHGRRLRACSSRAAAKASSSGAAETYQKV